MAAMAAWTCWVWRTVTENWIRWRWQAVITLADQKPESARRVSWPAAPARRAPAPGSLGNPSGAGGGAQQRVLAKQVGVAVGGALVVAVDLADGGVHVDRHRLLAGPGAG